MSAPGRSRGQSPAGGPLYGFSVSSDSGKKGTTPHIHRSNGTQTPGWTQCTVSQGVALQTDVQQKGIQGHSVLWRLPTELASGPETLSSPDGSHCRIPSEGKEGV